MNLIQIVFISAVCLNLLSCSLMNRRDSSGEERDSTLTSSGVGLPKQRIVVLPFLDLTPHQSLNISDSSRSAVVRELVATGEILAIPPTDFPEDLTKFKQGEGYDLESLSRKLSGLGVAAVLEGVVLEVRARRLEEPVGLFRSVKARVQASIRIRLYSTKSGRELVNMTRKAEIEESTTRFAEDATSDRLLAEDPQLIRSVVAKAFKGALPKVAQALSKVSWEGRVAMVQGEKIFINAGELSGLQIGDLLKITEDNQEIYDPETGGYIGQVPGRVKGTVEVVSYFGKDGAVAIVHSGSGFQTNDRVELY